MIRIVVLLAYFAASVGAQEPPPSPEPSPTERAEKLLRQGQHDAAMEGLRSAIAADRLAYDERILLARVLAWLGRSDEALSLLQEGIGLGDEDDDAKVQWHVGSLQQQLGDDGPFFQRRGAQVVYLPADKKIDEVAWRRERYQKALTAFRVVLTRQSDSEAVYERIGELESQLEEHDAALATWTAAQERFPGSSTAAFGRAKALAALGRVDEAIAACGLVLRIAPRLAEAHALLGELYRKAGNTKAAKQAELQAEFYEWAPNFLELDFAAASDAFARLAPRLPEEPSDEERKRTQEARNAEIKRLLETREAVSTRLLAVLCFNHEDHGEAEDRLFAELEARGVDAIPVLRALLEHAQTTCTQKGAAHALARLRAPGTLEALIEMLPGDVRPLFHADIAGALAELGDRAAVPALIEFAALSEEPDEDEAEEDFMTREARDEARLRAVLALGVLGGDAARAALQDGIARTPLKAACRVALYRLTRDETMIESVRAAVLADDSLQQMHLIEYLRAFAPALAKELDAKAGAEEVPEKKK